MPGTGHVLMGDQRIVSLLPSATEILCSLGLAERLVGVTHECDHPADVRRLPKVTNTLIPVDASSADIDALVRERMGTRSALYTLNMELLEQLHPDLIVTQALCDVCAVAESEVRAAACTLPGSPAVLNLEPETLDEVLQCILLVGERTGVPDRAREYVAALRMRVAAVESAVRGVDVRPRVALLEWLDPPFSTGHWNPEIIRRAGGVDGLGREGQKSVQLEWKLVRDWAPEVIVISCCGFTAERTLEELHILERVDGWSDLPAVRDGRVYVTDGSAYFSRPGPRLVDSLELLAHVIHPALFELPPWVSPPVQLPSPSEESNSLTPLTRPGAARHGGR